MDELDNDYERPRLKLTGKKKALWLWVSPIVILLFVLLPGLAGFYSDWLWFKEVGYEKVFLTQLRLKFYLGLIGSLLAALFLWANFKLALFMSSATSRQV